MTPNEFSQLLTDAINGNHNALEQILRLYLPLINKYSFIDDELDEDCRQYLLLHIALNINKFRI